MARSNGHFFSRAIVAGGEQTLGCQTATSLSFWASHEMRNGSFFHGGSFVCDNHPLVDFFVTPTKLFSAGDHETRTTVTDFTTKNQKHVTCNPPQAVLEIPWSDTTGGCSTMQVATAGDDRLGCLLRIARERGTERAAAWTFHLQRPPLLHKDIAHLAIVALCGYQLGEACGRHAA